MLTKVRKVIDPDGKDARDGQGVSVIFYFGVSQEDSESGLPSIPCS